MTPAETQDRERLEELPLMLRQEIEQFFSIYKDLEGHEVEIVGRRSREEAEREIDTSRERRRNSANPDADH